MLYYSGAHENTVLFRTAEADPNERCGGFFAPSQKRSSTKPK
jgi:hypothetical protein